MSRLVLFLSLLATNCSSWSNNCFSWHVFLDQWKRTQHSAVKPSSAGCVSATDNEFTDRKCQIMIFVHSLIIDPWFFFLMKMCFSIEMTLRCAFEKYIFTCFSWGNFSLIKAVCMLPWIYRAQFGNYWSKHKRNKSWLSFLG